jgi:hypothetical protein
LVEKIFKKRSKFSTFVVATIISVLLHGSRGRLTFQVVDGDPRGRRAAGRRLVDA